MRLSCPESVLLCYPPLPDPGYEGPTGSDSDSQLFHFMLIALLWVVIVLVLFLFRYVCLLSVCLSVLLYTYRSTIESI